MELFLEQFLATWDGQLYFEEILALALHARIRPFDGKPASGPLYAVVELTEGQSFKFLFPCLLQNQV